MMEAPSSCSSSRVEAFPAGLRVLVVDDDPTWLKILEKMLRKCSYEVTTCGLARIALEMLRTKRGIFDIVISDVNMPDMDGFKLLEHVGLEMDLPVIMMSVDGETSRVMKGIQHGACDYLLKPVRMKELRNIWQHVFRKKIHEIKEFENHDDSNEQFQFLNKEFAERRPMLYANSDLNSTQKRKDKIEDTENFADAEFFDQVSSVKKARVMWTVDLHQKFVDAVNQIGFDKVGPKKILDLMNVPGITRENVASHLQKYRLYLGRLQKQNYGVTIGGEATATATQTNAGGLKDTANFVLQIQKAVSHSNGKGRNHVDTTTKTEVRGDALKHAISQPQKDSSIKVLGSSSIKTVIPNSQYQMQQQHGNQCRNLEGIAAIPFTDYSNSIQPDYHQHMQQISTESKEKNNVCDIKSNLSCSKQTNLISFQVDHGLLGSKNYGIGPSDDFDQQQSCLFNSLDHPQLQKTVPSSSQYEYLNTIDVNSMDILNYNNSTQITQLQGDMQFDCEYVFELMKYPSNLYT